MALTKLYTKSPCALDRMIQEIQLDANVTVSLDLSATNLLGDQLTIAFKTDLADWTEIDSLVAAHSGQPLPQNQIQSVAVQNPLTVATQPAFAAKTITANGAVKKLYKRVRGIQQALAQGQNTFVFVIPYAWIKLTGLQLIACEALDTVDLKVLDTQAGTYSGVPNYALNQFGFVVNTPKDFYENHSEFEADLYQGMQIQVVYTSVSAKTVGVNFIMNEVK